MTLPVTAITGMDVCRALTGATGLPLGGGDVAGTVTDGPADPSGPRGRGRGGYHFEGH
ncbi:hypothetical protein [Saccharothrix australiensis]|uniref:Uncharacterized protein n=1 Tax=Saccharothrix australiensis TaxID=2072 RepID=A0A495VWD6_9PSEU|nr:hypothetical protein [Saccharothrix australiensis]RKT53230.1 hypothetical protein C8E97_1788 [Saccharothrix australiensis]